MSAVNTAEWLIAIDTHPETSGNTLVEVHRAGQP